MKKACVFLALLLLSAGVLSASVRLVFDVGPIYTHFTNHLSYNGSSKKYTHAENLFGVNLALRAEFVKNFGVYAMTNFAFGNAYWEHWSSPDSYGGNRHKHGLVYAIDSQFGFFYAFKPRPKLEIALGLGLGIGGNGFNREIKKSVRCTNIGAGLNADISYMFSKLVGIYGGICDTIYAPVAAAVTTKIDNEEDAKTLTGPKVQNEAGIGSVSNSFSIKAGIQFVF